MIRRRMAICVCFHLVPKGLRFGFLHVADLAGFIEQFGGFYVLKGDVFMPRVLTFLESKWHGLKRGSRIRKFTSKHLEG